MWKLRVWQVFWVFKIPWLFDFLIFFFFFIIMISQKILNTKSCWANTMFWSRSSIPWFLNVLFSLKVKFYFRTSHTSWTIFISSQVKFYLRTPHAINTCVNTCLCHEMNVNHRVVTDLLTNRGDTTIRTPGHPLLPTSQIEGEIIFDPTWKVEKAVSV